MSAYSWSPRSLFTSHTVPLRFLTRSFHATRLRLNATEANSNGNKDDSLDSRRKAPLLPLSRPLGVRQRPTNVPRTRAQKMKDLLDHDTRMAQRRHLIREAGKGYFHDMNMTRRHGGKTWIAPKVLIREDRSLYLPNISGKTLDDGSPKDTTTMCFGRITVLAMLGTQISQIHAKGFVEPTHQRYSSNPLYQYIQINLQENLLKSFLVKIFSNSLRSTVPQELQSNYLISNQNLEYVREPLGMTNSKVGYVYLIDENLRVRWAGCADPYAKEAEALETCTGVLLSRLEKVQAEKASSTLGSEPVESDTTSPKVDS